MKEPDGTYEGIMGYHYKMTLLLFLESRSMGGDKPLVTLSVHEQHPVGCNWAQSENTQRYDNFCFLPF